MNLEDALDGEIRSTGMALRMLAETTPNCRALELEINYRELIRIKQAVRSKFDAFSEMNAFAQKIDAFLKRWG